jgi:hypothetical protein
MRAPIVAVISAGLLVLGACSNDTSSTSASTTTVAAAGPTEPILFSPEGNNLNAFVTTPPFTMQRVNTANQSFNGAPSDPNGWDINGEICPFSMNGQNYLVTGEDTHQPDPPAGWGIFALSGTTVGDLSIDRVARLVPTYQPTPDNPDNYGCGVLSDGRILTTDIGNDAGGDANGQLEIWFPPYDSLTVSFCKIDTHLATGQAIYVDSNDDVYLNSPRPSDDPQATAGGIYKYTGPFPTSADAAGGCGQVDNLGSPLANQVNKTKVLSSGENNLVSPSGLTKGSNGHWFVSSVITGVINEYDQNWAFVQTVLQPPAGEALGEQSFSTGTPLGVAADADGNLFFADIGIVLVPGKTPGPGTKTGSVNRITFTNGKPNPPEVMADGLQFPDGLGIWSP